MTSVVTFITSNALFNGPPLIGCVQTIDVGIKCSGSKTQNKVHATHGDERDVITNDQCGITDRHKVRDRPHPPLGEANVLRRGIGADHPNEN